MRLSSFKEGLCSVEVLNEKNVEKVKRNNVNVIVLTGRKSSQIHRQLRLQLCVLYRANAAT